MVLARCVGAVAVVARALGRALSSSDSGRTSTSTISSSSPIEEVHGSGRALGIEARWTRVVLRPDTVVGVRGAWEEVGR